MFKALNPAGIWAPGPTYSHGVEVPGAACTLHISGQIGVDKSGRTGGDITEQTEIAFQNVLAILQESGMTKDNLVRLRCYLVNESDIQPFKTVRAEFLDGRKPASSMLIVKALGDPTWLVEIEAIAAKK